jgi:RND family efflux transporter MFP subunit
VRIYTPLDDQNAILLVNLRGFIFPLFSCVAALSACTKSSTPPLAELPPIRVEVRAVIERTSPVLLPVTGTVRPLRRATIAAKVTGVIEQLPITLGQRLASGELVAQLAASDLSARVAQATTQLAQARRDLERDTRLAAGGAATEDAVKIATDRVALAEAAFREAETTLGFATLRAPFDGVVSRRFVYAGDLATPGLPLIELESSDTFEVEVPVPDSLAGGLKPGTSLPVSVPLANEEFAGSVVEVSSAADSSARSVLAKISVPASKKVRSGQVARVLLSSASARTLLVPAQAVSVYGQMERVFVVTADKRASLRLVKTGASVGDNIEIVSGLEAGERIVVAPPTGLHDGQPLTFAP